jgi:hypothetical protein
MDTTDPAQDYIVYNRDSVRSLYRQHRKDRVSASNENDFLHHSRSKRVRADVSNQSRDEICMNHGEETHATAIKKPHAKNNKKWNSPSETPLMTNTTKPTPCDAFQSSWNVSYEWRFMNFKSSVKRDLTQRLEEVSSENLKSECYHVNDEITFGLEHTDLDGPKFSEMDVMNWKPIKFDNRPLKWLKPLGLISEQEDEELQEYFNNGQGIDLYEEEIRMIEQDGKMNGKDAVSDQSTNCHKGDSGWEWFKAPIKLKNSMKLKFERPKNDFSRHFFWSKQFEDINPEDNYSEHESENYPELIDFDSDDQDSNMDEYKRVSRFDSSSFNTPRDKSKRQARLADRNFKCPRKSNEKCDNFSSGHSKKSSNRKIGAHANFLDSMLQAPRKKKCWECSSILGPHSQCYDDLSQDRSRRRRRAREINVDELTISQIRNSSKSSPSRFNDLSWSRPLNILSRLSSRQVTNKSMERGFHEQWIGVEEKLRSMNI